MRPSLKLPSRVCISSGVIFVMGEEEGRKEEGRCSTEHDMTTEEGAAGASETAISEGKARRQP